jgi:hypothetical protein
MATVTKEMYDRLIENRPFKFAPEEVGYQKADDGNRCDTCIHFFLRKTDGFAVCEIMRDPDGDESVIPNYRCMFQSSDGEEYPYIEE